MNMEHLEFIKEANWREIFEVQMANEDNKDWRNVAKAKGWPTVREWREFMAKQFGAAERRWRIVRVLSPNTSIPQFRVGPFQGWHHTYFKDSDLSLKDRTFEKLVELKRDELIRNTKIAGIRANFPQQTQLIGIHFPGGRIVCMEGSHRSATVALAEALNQAIDFSQREVTIALTDFKENEEGILDEMLKRGSDKVKK